MKKIHVEGVGEVDVNITRLSADSAKSIPKELDKLEILFAPSAKSIPKELDKLTRLYAPSAKSIPKELDKLTWLSADSATSIPDNDYDYCNNHSAKRILNNVKKESIEVTMEEVCEKFGANVKIKK